ncbi:unnamed protein product [Owenia fusiformis]|uniref:Uncharacterized protein n=1 Tax=Owenia fusiformis TaxID=6347 RepID=A0A8J1UKX5_OWEFU|nr:unnamed protein product [Owenia fusiformis]
MVVNIRGVRPTLIFNGLNRRRWWIGGLMNMTTKYRKFIYLAIGVLLMSSFHLYIQITLIDSMETTLIDRRNMTSNFGCEERKSKNFIVLTSDYSNVDALAELINIHPNLKLDTKLFDRIVKIDAKGAQWSYTKLLAYIKMYLVGGHKHCGYSTGFVITPRQLDKHRLKITDFAKVLPHFKLVVLYRKNILEQFLEKLILESTNARSLNSNSAKVKVTITWLKFVQFMADERKYWHEHLKDIHQHRDKVFITSEALGKDSSTPLQSVTRYLGFNSPQRIYTPMDNVPVKLSAQKNIENYKYMRELITNTAALIKLDIPALIQKLHPGMTTDNIQTIDAVPTTKTVQSTDNIQSTETVQTTRKVQSTTVLRSTTRLAQTTLKSTKLPATASKTIHVTKPTLRTTINPVKTTKSPVKSTVKPTSKSNLIISTEAIAVRKARALQSITQKTPSILLTKLLSRQEIKPTQEYKPTESTIQDKQKDEKVSLKSSTTSATKPMSSQEMKSTPEYRTLTHSNVEQNVKDPKSVDIEVFSTIEEEIEVWPSQEDLIVVTTKPKKLKKVTTKKPS